MASKEVPSELIRAKDVSAFARWDLPSLEPLASEPVYRAEPSAEELAAAAAAAVAAAAWVTCGTRTSVVPVSTIAWAL